jgi:hypothetical protein
LTGANLVGGLRDQPARQRSPRIPGPHHCRHPLPPRPSAWYQAKHAPSFADILITLRRTIIATQYQPGRLVESVRPLGMRLLAMTGLVPR